MQRSKSSYRSVRKSVISFLTLSVFELRASNSDCMGSILYRWKEGGSWTKISLTLLLLGKINSFHSYFPVKKSLSFPSSSSYPFCTQSLKILFTLACPLLLLFFCTNEICPYQRTCEKCLSGNAEDETLCMWEVHPYLPRGRQRMTLSSDGRRNKFNKTICM